MNNIENRINSAYNLPQGFYKHIVPYIATEKRRTITNPDELLTLWQEALRYRDEYSTLQESIAEWTVSAAASSPLINDNNIFEAIHAAFGELEVSAQDSDVKWQALKTLVDTARTQVEND